MSNGIWNTTHNTASQCQTGNYIINVCCGLDCTQTKNISVARSTGLLLCDNTPDTHSTIRNKSSRIATTEKNVDLLNTSKTLVTAATPAPWASPANSVMIETTGTWTDGALNSTYAPTGTSKPSDIGTDTIEWGNQYKGIPLSSDNFSGSNLDVDVNISDPFVLSTFTHDNYPIYQPTLLSA